jgi:hypothetical protein
MGDVRNEYKIFARKHENKRVRGRPKRRKEDNITRVYPEFSGLAACSENCKLYSSLPLGAVVSLFCELV